MEKVIISILGISGTVALVAALTGQLSAKIAAVALAVFLGALLGVILAIAMILMWRDGWEEGRKRGKVKEVERDTLERQVIIVMDPAEFRRRYGRAGVPENAVVHVVGGGDIREVV